MERALIRDGDRILTHCNAGALATAGYGTALAVLYAAWAEGKRFHVFVDETRPLLQGAQADGMGTDAGEGSLSPSSRTTWPAWVMKKEGNQSCSRGCGPDCPKWRHGKQDRNLWPCHLSQMAWDPFLCGCSDFDGRFDPRQWIGNPDRRERSLRGDTRSGKTRRSKRGKGLQSCL